ncbi:hypothetical protein D9M68_182320 [compost metagenome]
MDENYAAGQARRCEHPLLVVDEDVGCILRVHVSHVLREGEGFLHLHDGVGAVHLRGDLRHQLAAVGAAIAGFVVPHDFHAALGDREGVVARLLEVLQAITVVHRFGGHRAAFRRVVDRLWCGCAAVGGVDRNSVGIRIALEQGLLAGCQFVLVLRDVGGRDDEQWLFIGERIAEKAVGVHRRCARLQAAGPGGDAAVGIAGLLRAKRGQGSAQLRRLLRGNSGHDSGGQQRQRQGAGFQYRDGFHAWFPLPGWIRSSRRS